MDVQVGNIYFSWFFGLLNLTPASILQHLATIYCVRAKRLCKGFTEIWASPLSKLNVPIQAFVSILMGKGIDACSPNAYTWLQVQNKSDPPLAAQRIPGRAYDPKCQ